MCHAKRNPRQLRHANLASKLPLPVEGTLAVRCPPEPAVGLHSDPKAKAGLDASGGKSMGRSPTQTLFVFCTP